MSDEMNNYYNQEPPQEEGKGFAIAALVLGCCGLILSILFLLLTLGNSILGVMLNLSELSSYM